MESVNVNSFECKLGKWRERYGWDLFGKFSSTDYFMSQMICFKNKGWVVLYE